ncbi:MAG: hypothetical protein E3J72_07440 [Planctomycetota bacterium]|nr:MAG: hypothetical protein E3J72_07440 [Planctomycetota bacterium]
MSDFYDSDQVEPDIGADMQAKPSSLLAVVTVIMVTLISGGLAACAWIHYHSELEEKSKAAGELSERLKTTVKARNHFRKRFVNALKEKDTAENQVAELTRVVTDQNRQWKEIRQCLSKTKKELNKKLDTAENHVVELVRKIIDQRRDLAELSKYFNAVKRELNEYKDKQRLPPKPGIPVDDLVKKIPKIDAVVTLYRKGAGLVVLNAGKNDGVEPGCCFTVFNNSDFVAQIEVEKVMPRLCGCRVMFSTGEIEKGMTATTRLK